MAVIGVRERVVLSVQFVIKEAVAGIEVRGTESPNVSTESR